MESIYDVPLIDDIDDHHILRGNKHVDAYFDSFGELSLINIESKISC